MHNKSAYFFCYTILYEVVLVVVKKIIYKVVFVIEGMKVSLYFHSKLCRRSICGYMGQVNREMRGIVKSSNLKNKFKNKKHYKTIAIILFFGYIVILSNLVFFSEYYDRTVGSSYSYNLIPFQEINRFIKYRHYLTFEEWTSNLLGNIFVFMPLGFLMPMIGYSYRKFYKILIISFLVSLNIEVLQLIFRVGIFDVDDLILNTLGGVIGYILFKLVYKIYINRRNK